MDKVKSFFVAIGMWFAHVGIAIAKWFKNWFVVVDGKDIIPVRIGGWFVNWKKPNKDGTTVWSRFFDKDSGKSIVSSLICIAIGLVLGILFIVFTNVQNSPSAIVSLLSGSFGNTVNYPKELARLLIYAAPLICTGLAVGFAFKAGLFNIGVAGQYVIGILFLYIAVFSWQLPWYLCTICAMLGGALWACLPGLLKAFCSVSEVISGIMLNWIALYMTNSMLKDTQYYILDRATCYTISGDYTLPTLGLDELLSHNNMGIGILLAIFAAFIIWGLLNKTKLGYEIKATGANKHAAKYAGMSENTIVIITMAISGALAGLGAAVYYQCGVVEYNPGSSVLPTMGFDGIAVAFLGALSPIGIVLSALFVQHITWGGSKLDSTYYSSEIADFAIAIIIYACAFTAFLQQYIDKRRAINKAKLLAAKVENDTEVVADESEHVDLDTSVVDDSIGSEGGVE